MNNKNPNLMDATMLDYFIESVIRSMQIPPDGEGDEIRIAKRAVLIAKLLLDCRNKFLDNDASIRAVQYPDGVTLCSEWNKDQGCFEDSFVEPEKDWEPKVGQWVVLPDGKPGKVSAHREHSEGSYCMIEGTNTAFAPGCLKPWVPKVNDRVRVSYESSMNFGCVGIVERDDGKFEPYLVRFQDGYGWYIMEQLEPVNHIPDATKMVDQNFTVNDGSRTVPSSPAGWSAEPDAFIGFPHHQRQPVPNGWKVLHPSSKEERREVGDRFFRVSKSHWEELTEANIAQANFQSWAAIRKIPSEVVDSSELLGSSLTANCLEVPEGWRELEPNEVPSENDMYEHEQIWMKRFAKADEKYIHFGRRHIRKIEPNTSETPNSSIPDPGEGYRLLSKDPPEPLQHGDEYWSDIRGKWHESPSAAWGSKIQSGNDIYRRKIELANTSETPKSSTPEPQYREPTHADLAYGPIEVEVCEGEIGDDYWKPRTLLAILPANIWHRYVTSHPGRNEFSQSWKHARIKIEPHHKVQP